MLLYYSPIPKLKIHALSSLVSNSAIVAGAFFSTMLFFDLPERDKTSNHSKLLARIECVLLVVGWGFLLVLISDLARKVA